MRLESIIKLQYLTIMVVLFFQSCRKPSDVEKGNGIGNQYSTIIREQNIESGEITNIIEITESSPFCNYLNTGQIVVSDQEKLYLFEGNNEKKVIDISPVSVLFNYYSVSPNAPIIYFMGTESILSNSSDPHNIYSYDFSSNTLKQLTNCSDGEFPKYPVPSNDGEYITYVMHWSYSYRSPDGNDSISKIRQDNYAINIMSNDGSDQKELVFLEDYTNNALFGPNDEEIYYATQYSRIHKYNLLDKSTEIIIPNIFLFHTSEINDYCNYRMFSICNNYLSYSTSSEYEVYQTNQSVKLYNLETGEISEVAKGIKPFIYKDEEKILYRENVDFEASDATNFKIIDFNGNVLTTLDSGQRVFLSNDKKKILYTYYKYHWE